MNNKQYVITFINPNKAEGNPVKIRKDFTCEAAMIKYVDKYLPAKAESVRMAYNGLRFRPSWADPSWN